MFWYRSLGGERFRVPFLLLFFSKLIAGASRVTSGVAVFAGLTGNVCEVFHHGLLYVPP
jgi:hypothetical protein